MAGRAGDGLRHHAALGVEQPDRKITGLTHRGGEGGAQQRLRLLLDDGEQAVPDHLQLNLASPAHAVTRRIMTIEPSLAIAAS